MSRDSVPKADIKTHGGLLKMNVPCLICFGIQNDVFQETLLAEYGATRLWNDFQRHEKERHEQEVRA